MRVWRFACLLLAAASAARADLANGPRGPIAIRNQRPYQTLVLQFLPEAPDLLSRGSRAFRMQFDVSNNLLNPPPSGGATVFEDAEQQRLSAWWRVRSGMGEWSVNVPLIWRNGGFLDEVIHSWHRLFMLGDPGGRSGIDDYDSRLLIRDPAGAVLLDARSAFGLGDVQVGWKQPLGSPSPRSAFAARAAVKLPTGSARDLLGSGAADAGLNADGRYNVGRDIVIYAGIGGIVAGRATRVPNSKSKLYQAYGAVEYNPNSRDSYVLQIDTGDVIVRTGSAMADRSPVTVTFGYKRRMKRDLFLTAAFSENGDYHTYDYPILGNIGPDFTATLALEWRR